MFYRHFRPIPALTPYIDNFWIIETGHDTPSVGIARMPADSRTTLLLNFIGESNMSAGDGATYSLGMGAYLLGARSRSYVLEHEGDTLLVAAQFRPGGLAAFVRCGIGELSEQMTPLNSIWGRPASILAERIYDAKSAAEKVTLYQSLLMERFADVPHRPRIEHSIAQIDAAQTNVSVEWLASQANWSQKQFERQFERTVGMMPKRYIRLARFQKLVRLLSQCAGAANWSALAAQFGYYDQSHLAKDFQAFAGTTASEFLEATAGIVEVAYGEPDETKSV
jgi:AraC-like DNA-binding protein